MADAEMLVTASDQLLTLARRLEAQSGFAEAIASLTSGHGATLDGVWGSSCALAAAALASHAPGPLVVVLPHADDIDLFLDDLSLFTTASRATFPAFDAAPTEIKLDDETHAARLRLLKSLAAGAAPPRLIVTSIQSLLQPTPRAAVIAAQTRTLQRGDQVDVDELVEWFISRGFQHTSAVALPGEISRRGGILDMFAPDADEPVRLEFFGDDIESIRRFEIASQRSLGAVDTVDVTSLDPRTKSDGHFASYLSPESWFLLVEPSELEDEGRAYRERLDAPDVVHTTAAVLREAFRFPSVTASAVARGSLETTCHLKIESVERFSGDIGKVRGELDAAGAGQEVFVVCQTEAETHRLGEVFASTQLAAAGRLHLIVGRLRAGFRLVSDGVVLVSGSELFRREDVSRPSRRRLGRVIDSFLDLRPGDYVVHLAHGIGRYRGLKLLEKTGQLEEHLELEFHGGTKIFVPATKIDLVQKYVGGSKSRPTLARIGGRTWVRQKAAAEKAVIDMASEMLELQANRAARPGIAFPSDTDWQQEFDAAFPYVETPDQLTAAAAIKQDMIEPRPMDRLICGDVGYGKTELAMRAAFKAIDSGRQVAVLVPTTVLAMQHYRTFSSRMAEYPFQIASLSRFGAKSEQKKVIQGLAEGAVDIVIGTHRLAQHDVAFHNLGLIVIDEEQRFGVAVKERLKAIRQSVDVLTLTATPIPRTLHMSLLGVRDISNLETPPADRLAVETRVTRFDPELVRHAVMRELNRGGQVFFVHNRIKDIHVIARRLREIVPEARIEIGHGQLPEAELERVMLDFVNHEFDLLLATTIVESGLDIPNANTILIDEADHYGLADLHQLRGRVGRYKHRAYCYLLIDPNKSLTPTAAKRLHAIEEFSDMGAGFAIAMRDLEIRGAGNILGTEQSGHIAAVGYELYCALLEKAVRRLKRLPPKTTVDVNVDLPGEAYIPRGYVPDQRLKIDLYRRLGRAATDQDLQDLAGEFVDRFGPRPAAVDRLLALAELRVLAHRWQIRSIHLEDAYLVFGYTSRPLMEQLAAASAGRLRVADARSAYLPLGKQLGDPDSMLSRAKSLLQAS